METNEKIVIISTTGPESPEKATLPFVLATAAQSMDVEVTVILQSEAVWLSKKGEAEKVRAKGLLPLKELLDTFIELEGKLMLCSPCIKERNISKEELIEGSELIAAGTVVTEVLSASNVVNY
ncbi:MAG TPA: DsrE family protein [Bacteroidales bacterium]|nr:DsrE family protein [Bacteroidales bacterium]